MRSMADGIVAGNEPPGCDLYAGYVGGNWPDYAAVVTRFPRAVHVSIAVQADEAAMVLDVETGDATPAQAPAWALRQRVRGQIPTVYMNASTWPAVRAQFAAQKVAPPQYWVAQYDGVAQLPAGAVAKQYENTPGYDLSVVADHWPGVDPPQPPTPSEDDMQFIVYVKDVTPAVPAVAAAPGIWKAINNDTYQALVAAGAASPHAQRVSAVRWDELAKLYAP